MCRTMWPTPAIVNSPMLAVAFSQVFCSPKPPVFKFFASLMKPSEESAFRIPTFAATVCSGWRFQVVNLLRKLSWVPCKASFHCFKIVVDLATSAWALSAK